MMGRDMAGQNMKLHCPPTPDDTGGQQKTPEHTECPVTFRSRRHGPDHRLVTFHCFLLPIPRS